MCICVHVSLGSGQKELWDALELELLAISLPWWVSGPELGSSARVVIILPAQHLSKFNKVKFKKECISQIGKLIK